MYEFHSDRNRYFRMQAENASQYVLPFLSQVRDIDASTTILEIGCGEGGVLLPFLEKGCTCVGIDYDRPRIELAQALLKTHLEAGRLRLMDRDIYQVDPVAEFGHRFDIIVLKDVIEHIHDQPKLLREMHRYLNPGGFIFFGFPPWQMPFGGHQQICHHRLLSRLPYYHLLPRPLYRAILKKYQEPVDDLLEIRDTRISIEGFERMVRRTGFRIAARQLYLINPIYEYKFHLKGRKQLPLLRSLPWIRNFVTTCAYYLIQPQPGP